MCYHPLQYINISNKNHQTSDEGSRFRRAKNEPNSRYNRTSYPHPLITLYVQKLSQNHLLVFRQGFLLRLPDNKLKTPKKKIYYHAVYRHLVTNLCFLPNVHRTLFSVKLFFRQPKGGRFPADPCSTNRVSFYFRKVLK